MFSPTKIAKQNPYTKETAIYPYGSGQNHFLNLMNSHRGILPVNMFQTRPQPRLFASDHYKAQVSFDLSNFQKAKNEHSKEILDWKDNIKEEQIKIEEVSPYSQKDEFIATKMNEQKNYVLPYTQQQVFQPSLMSNNSQMQQILFENILRRTKIEYTKHFIDQMQKKITQFSRDFEEESQNIFSNLPNFPSSNQLTGFPSSLNFNQNPVLTNLASTQFPFQQNFHANSQASPNPFYGNQELIREDNTIIAKVKQSKKIKKELLVERKKSQTELLKNITKNYGKACSKFACGPDGLTFLKKYVIDEEETKEFQEFTKSNAENIKNIPFFRESILVMPNDPPKIAKFKKIFKSLCETFVSRFAVKWIFSSKQLLNRRGHLSYRRKILRRIQDPENFVNLNN